MHSIRFQRLWVILASLLLLGTGTGVQAQVIRGVVLDEDAGKAIDGVSVMLIDADEEVAHGVLTDEAGVFFMEAPRTGRYRLRCERIGYQSTTSGEVDLLPPDTVSVEMRMGVEAIVLAPLTITSRREPLVMDVRLASWGYYDRRVHYGTMGTGVAHFLDFEAIKKRNPMDVSDLFRDLAGMRVASLGGRRIQVQGMAGCRPTFYVDGVRLTLRRHEGIDDWVIPSHLAAVEVYARPPYPAQYWGSCGSIVIWTGWVTGK